MPAEAYGQLLVDKERAVEVAKTPKDRKQLSSREWRDLMKQNESLAIYALTERSWWGIAESFPPEYVITLTHENPILATLAFERFQLHPVNPTGCLSSCFSFFSSDKLSPAQWSRVAMHSGDAATEIMKHMGPKFNAQQLFNIAVSNAAVRQTVVTTYSKTLTTSHKEELAPMLQADEAQAKLSAVSTAFT